MLSYPALSRRSTGTMDSSDFSSGIPPDFSLRLIPTVTLVLYLRPDETHPVPSPTYSATRIPYTGGTCPEQSEEFFTGAFQGLRRFCCLRHVVRLEQSWRLLQSGDVHLVARQFYEILLNRGSRYFFRWSQCNQRT